MALASSTSPKRRCPAARRPKSRTGTTSVGIRSETSCERRRTSPGSSICGSCWAVPTGLRRRIGPITAFTSSRTVVKSLPGTTSGFVPTPRSPAGTRRAGSLVCSRWKAGGSAASYASRSNSRNCSKSTRAWASTAFCSPSEVGAFVVRDRRSGRDRQMASPIRSAMNCMAGTLTIFLKWNRSPHSSGVTSRYSYIAVSS
jgi:hypothetical protein